MSEPRTLAADLLGSWRLTAREDRTLAGEPRVDPGLGADPIALLVYDRGGNFAAQFMKRDRSTPAAMTDAPAPRGANNSTSVNGYDAYFGTYTVDEESRTVTQRLDAALSPGDVGKVVTREMKVAGDQLTIQLQTTSSTGEAIIRTLRWKRSA